MAEYRNNIRIVIDGEVEEHGGVHEAHEGIGAIVLVDNGEGIGGSILGGWNAMTLGSAIRVLRNLAGKEMFAEAMMLLTMCDMAVSDKEAENERKAAAAAGEAQDEE